MNVELNRTPNPSVHGGLFLATLFAAAFTVPGIAWPWYLLLPTIAYGILVAVIPPLRRTIPRLAIGRIGGMPLAFAFVLIAITVAVLVAFHLLMRPDAVEVAESLPDVVFGSLILTGIWFSSTNACLEEFVFRGMLWEAAAAEWNSAAAVAITSVMFGVGHLHGYPPGLLGATLAGCYGVCLGLLRIWTGGLGLGVLCHVTADATIFVLLTSSPGMDAN